MYEQLTEGQRYQISVLYAQGVSQSDTAKCIGVNKSTVSRELRRNSQASGYNPGKAHATAMNRRAGAAKRQVSESSVDFVEMALEWDWSPEQISSVASKVGLSVSHEWIYQHVQRDRAKGGELYRHLRQHKRRYRKGYGQRRPVIADAVSIEQRPTIVDERGRLGDWEADLVLGKQGSGAIVTLVERVSKLYLIKGVPSKEAAVVSEAIIEMLTPYKQECHTITFDNGREFSGHKDIAKALDADMYFAHPYASQERGLNENFNGLLRQYVPKGTDLKSVPEESLGHYQSLLNGRPRKCLDYEQPSVVFSKLRASPGVALRT
ncbi:TPA: IS30 family transposase [Aeromonas sobria]|nr:IS30 family transposase [Aeromonas sobria]